MTKPMKKLDQETLAYIKKQGYWKERSITYVIEEYHFPHDERCEKAMCWCFIRAKKENPSENGV